MKTQHDRNAIGPTESRICADPMHSSWGDEVETPRGFKKWRAPLIVEDLYAVVQRIASEGLSIVGPEPVALEQHAPDRREQRRGYPGEGDD